MTTHARTASDTPRIVGTEADEPEIKAKREEIRRIFGLLNDGFKTHVTKDIADAWFNADRKWAEPPAGSDYTGYWFRWAETVTRLAPGGHIECAVRMSQSEYEDAPRRGVSVSMSITRGDTHFDYLHIDSLNDVDNAVPQDIPALHAALPSLVRLVRENFPMACRTL